MDNSPFARLPPELREHIYCLALQQNETITFERGPYRHHRGNYKTNLLQHRPVLSHPHPLAISQVCRHARAETPIRQFYVLNTWRIETELLPYVKPWYVLHNFLDIIGPSNARHLRNLEFYLKDPCGVFGVGVSSAWDMRESMLRQLVRLRKWCLLHPKVRLEVIFGRPHDSSHPPKQQGLVAMVVELQSLRVERLHDRDADDAARRRRVLDSWMPALWAINGTNCGESGVPTGEDC